MSKTSKFRMSDRSEDRTVHKDSVGAEEDMLCGADGGVDDDTGGSYDIDFSRVVKEVSFLCCYLIDYQNLV